MRIAGSCLAVVLLAASAVAEEAWTVEDAVVALHEIVSEKTPTREAQAERNRRVESWLEHVVESELDLGEFEYLKAIPLYFRREAAAAGDLLLAYLAERDGFPTKDFDLFTGRILLGRAATAVRDGEIATAERAFDQARELYPRRDLVYSAIGAACRRRGDLEALALLVRINRRIVEDEALTPEEKLAIFDRLYRSRPTRTLPGRVEYGDLSIETIDGRTITRADLEDKVVLVDYWGTWCGPCRMAVPHLKRLQETYGPKGLVILGLAYEKGPPETHREKVEAYAKEAGIPYPLALGTDALKRAVPGFSGYPTLVFLRRGLKFDHMTVGFSPDHPEEIEAWLKKALAED